MSLWCKLCFNTICDYEIIGKEGGAFTGAQIIESLTDPFISGVMRTGHMSHSHPNWVSMSESLVKEPFFFLKPEQIWSEFKDSTATQDSIPKC